MSAHCVACHETPCFFVCPLPAVSESLPGMAGDGGGAVAVAPQEEEDIIGLAFAYHKGADRLVRHRSRLPAPIYFPSEPCERTSLSERRPRDVRVISHPERDRSSSVPENSKTPGHGVGSFLEADVRVSSSPYREPCLSPLDTPSVRTVGRMEVVQEGPARDAPACSGRDVAEGERRIGGKEQTEVAPPPESEAPATCLPPSKEVCEEGGGEERVFFPFTSVEGSRRFAPSTPQATVDNRDLTPRRRRVSSPSEDERGSVGRTKRESDLESLPSSPSSPFSENSFVSRPHAMLKQGEKQPRRPLRLPPCLANSQQLGEECLVHLSPRSPFSAVGSSSSRASSPSSSREYVLRTTPRAREHKSSAGVSPRERHGGG